MREHRFEIIEHTADKGVAAEEKTLPAAFESAAFGMFSLMAELPKYTPTRTIEIEVSGMDRETLFHNWLRELLFVFEVEYILPLDFEIFEFNENHLKARVMVREMGPDIEWLGSPVKAVTFHEMKIEPVDGGWHVQAILDV
jgi:SHS2 domain-containing protein